jgi:uncharacterized protein (DUF1810 family)
MTAAADPFDLRRFVTAQDPVFPAVLAELTAGRKRSHWMWFVFPQLAGLGRSALAQHYGIASRQEARAFLDHAVLGHRLRQCTEAVVGHPHAAPEAIFGHVDAVKFRSSMTLFEAACGGSEPLFAAALATFFGAQRDGRTLALLD